MGTVSQGICTGLPSTQGPGPSTIPQGPGGELQLNPALSTRTGPQKEEAPGQQVPSFYRGRAYSGMPTSDTRRAWLLNVHYLFSPSQP